MHTTRYGVFLVMVLAIGLGLSGCTPAEFDTSQFQASMPEPPDSRAKYLSTIPPEVLEQYDPKVVDDTQRTVVVITQAMIWQLRDERPVSGDVYRFNLDPAKLSTVQKEIIRHWLSDGHTVLLWGEKDVNTYAQLFPDIMTVGTGTPDEQLRLAAHAVNTDVHALRFLTSRYRDRNKPWHYRCVTTYPANTEIVASVNTGGLAGKIPFGKGAVYFASIGDRWDRGADKDRWELNFRQWMLRKPVPRAAATHGGAPSSQEPQLRFIHQVKPAYPALAVQQRQEGTVTLALEYEPDGTVGTVEVTESSGSPVLDETAKAAVQTWRVVPAMPPPGAGETHQAIQRIHFRLTAGVQSDGLFVMPMEQPARTYVVITGDRVNIRTAPSVSAPVVAQALKGDIFTQHGKEGQWYTISMFSGEWRYVHTSFASETPSHVAVPPDVITRREIFDAHLKAESRLQTDVDQSLTERIPFLAGIPTDQRATAYQALLMDRYRLAVAHQFGIRVPEYGIIVAEGLQKGW